MKRKIVIQWLIKANGDLKTSEILLKSEALQLVQFVFTLKRIQKR
ncbi:MAG: hypothetical protein KatS3mg078_0046 [Deltaproteobacteria bacterium]|nr:MAG: hypothetical protein KatS3mg078_0046 [Deltaproteobacteria bacterium]